MTSMEERVVETLRQAGEGVDWLIETGTADGYTSNALKDDFKHVVTIEIDHDRYKHVATSVFLGSNVLPLWGDSADLLARVLYYLEEPALFWLDAHYSGGERLAENPIVAELKAILYYGIGHRILVDDARLFGTDPEYPSLEWIEKMATTHDYSYEVADDIIRLFPNITL